MSPVRIRLAELRQAKAWSQAELARQSGVPQSTISRIESGNTPSIDLTNLDKLAGALEVDPSLLIVRVQAKPRRR